MISAGAKLYLVVRADLTPGEQLAQAAHVAQEFVFEQPKAAQRWRQTSGTVVVVTVPSVGALETLRRRAVERDVPISRFDDPDYATPFTALALGPAVDAARLCRGLPLALRPVV